MATMSREEEAQQLEAVSKGFPRTALRATFHLRRYMPLYVFATIWVLMVALIPTVNHKNSGGTNLASGNADAGATAEDQAGTQVAAGGTADASSGGAAQSGAAGGSQSAAASS